MSVPEMRAVWVGVAIVVAIVVVAVVVTAVRRRRGPGFQVHALPADRLDGYEQRLDELERLFVSEPREALANARQLVDEMLVQMGYPARLKPAERARDLSYSSREHARRYNTAAMAGDSSTTEEMRRAIKHFVDMGRELVADSRSDGGFGRTAPAASEPIDAPAGPVGPAPAGEAAGVSATEAAETGTAPAGEPATEPEPEREGRPVAP